jgi:predicted anti-sigma-YlaC factor YlaD
VTAAPDQRCHAVQLAAMSRLDGEAEPGSGDEYDAHVTGCADCREAIAAMTRLHAELDSVSYDAAPADLWPAIQGRIGRRRLPGARERLGCAVLAALVLAWRTAQLVFDVPVPVLNALVPLTVAMFVGWWVAGDPLAIRSVVLEEQEERA